MADQLYTKDENNVKVPFTPVVDKELPEYSILEENTFLHNTGTELEWKKITEISVDSSISSTSINPVQNKVISKSLDTLNQKISSKVDSSVGVRHSGTGVGDVTRPIYVNSTGQATVCSYSISTNVPADAKFTDTTVDSVYFNSTESAAAITLISGSSSKSANLTIATKSRHGTIKVGSNLSISQDGELSGNDNYVLPTATSSTLGGVKIGSNINISETGIISVKETYKLPKATTVSLGGVIVGENLSITDDGILNADNQQKPLEKATKSSLGGVIVGENLSITSAGVIDVEKYTLPKASTSSLGGIIVGDNLSVTSDGLLSANDPYVHPTASAVTPGLYKVGVDSLGHVVIGNEFVLPSSVASATTASNVSGIVAIENGGTGGASAEAAIANLGVAKTSHTHTAANIIKWIGTSPVSSAGKATTASTASYAAPKYNSTITKTNYSITENSPELIFVNEAESSSITISINQEGTSAWEKTILNVSDTELVLSVPSTWKQKKVNYSSYGENDIASIQLYWSGTVGVAIIFGY